MGWEAARLIILRDQLAAAKRRLEWAVKHDRPWEEIEDKSNEVVALKWAVEMAAKAAKEDECQNGGN